MDNKSQVQIIAPLIIILIIVLGVLIFVTVDKTQFSIFIEQDKLIRPSIEVKSVSLFSLISPKEESRGVNKLYLEIRDKNTNEIVLVSTKENIGGGEFTVSLSKAEFQKWVIQAELKKLEKNQLKNLDKKCFEASFEFGFKTGFNEVKCS